MKKIIILLAVIVLTFSVSAKDSKTQTPPANVKNAVAKAYPNAKDVKFDKETKGWEAEFTNNGTKMSMDIDNNGNVLSTETTIKLSELPKGVEEYINKNYKGYKVTEASKIVDSHGRTTFEAEVSKDGKSKDLIFDKEGKFVK